MLNQSDITKTASVIYRCLNHKKGKSVQQMANLMNISEGRCQLILTQLVMAGMAVEDEKEGIYKRSQ